MEDELRKVLSDPNFSTTGVNDTCFPKVRGISDRCFILGDGSHSCARLWLDVPKHSEKQLWNIAVY